MKENTMKELKKQREAIYEKYRNMPVGKERKRLWEKEREIIYKIMVILNKK